MSELRKKLSKELKNLQMYIDEGYFEYDLEKDMQLDYINMDSQDLIDQVRKWDFTPVDNAIWHYTRITLLEELIRAEEE